VSVSHVVGQQSTGQGPALVVVVLVVADEQEQRDRSTTYGGGMNCPHARCRWRHVMMAGPVCRSVRLSGSRAEDWHSTASKIDDTWIYD
jgi:hypothetical protein